jgi:hypothetical protein
MTFLEKLAYKMENDNISAGALAGGIGAGLYASSQHQQAAKAMSKSTITGLKRGAGIGAGVGAVGGVSLGKDLADVSEVARVFDSTVPKRKALIAGTAIGSSVATAVKGSVIGAGVGAIKGHFNAQALRGKRNAALAVAGLLGATALATKEK